MPCPIDLYQGCLYISTSISAACQRLSSAMCVPERSPREINGVPFSLMAERRNNVLAAVDAGGIALLSDQDEVVVHHRVALYARPIGDGFFLCCPRVAHNNHALP